MSQWKLMHNDSLVKQDTFAYGMIFDANEIGEANYDAFNIVVDTQLKTMNVVEHIKPIQVLREEVKSALNISKLSFTEKLTLLFWG